VNADSPADIRALLSERGIALKKRWGQNFLINRGARENIVRLLAAQPGETVWEIGPGLGAMTERLASTVRVVAFEIDRGLCRFLEEDLGRQPGVRIVAGDFLETWRPEMSAAGAPARVLGNLPYRSASLMLADLIEAGLRPKRMVFTVQKELAERMASAPKRKSYSSFSVLCQSCFSVKLRGDLQPGSFFPTPDVISTIVEMEPRVDAPAGETLAELTRLARALFSSRRKTIRNNAGDRRTLEALVEEGVDPGARAEELPPTVYVRLAGRLAGGRR
jgi:16S rRNA (adenine1518-N6/adenine1519-N6)-dimethyltransferase